MAICTGARGPHVVDCPASWAFDAQIKGRPLGKHLVAVSASDFVVVCSLHFDGPCLAPPHPSRYAFTRSRSDCEP